MIRLVGIGDNVVDLHYDTGIMYPGGNSVNFSVYARRMGYETAYIGVFGNDDAADLIQTSLRKEGVNITHCVVKDGPTGRSGINLIDGDRIITEENDGGVVKSQPLKLESRLLGYICSYDVIHTSHLSYIDDQLPLLNETGLPIIYDFSVFWTDDLFEKVCPYIDVAFLSGVDHEMETKRKVLGTIIKRYGCKLAIMTSGGQGALVYDGDKWYSNLPYNYSAGAVDTTGAGDSWLTGFATTFFQHTHLFKELVIDPTNPVIRPCDKSDYFHKLIPFAMANGNLLARYHCQFNGGFGHGTPIKVNSK